MDDWAFERKTKTCIDKESQKAFKLLHSPAVAAAVSAANAVTGPLRLESACCYGLWPVTTTENVCAKNKNVDDAVVFGLRLPHSIVC